MCYVIEINGARYDVELGAFSRLTGTVFHDYYMVLSALYANMKLQEMMIMQKCDQSIVQNVAQNLFIRVQ